MRRPYFRLPLRSSAATRLIHVKVKGRFSGEVQPTIKTIRLCVPTAYEAQHTSHFSQPKAHKPPESLNKATETFSRDFSEGIPAGGFKRTFWLLFVATDKKLLASAAEGVRRNSP